MTDITKTLAKAVTNAVTYLSINDPEARVLPELLAAQRDHFNSTRQPVSTELTYRGYSITVTSEPDDERDGGVNQQAWIEKDGYSASVDALDDSGELENSRGETIRVPFFLSHTIWSKVDAIWAQQRKEFS